MQIKSLFCGTVSAFMKKEVKKGMKQFLPEFGVLCKLPENPELDFSSGSVAASLRLRTESACQTMGQSEPKSAVLKRLLVRQKTNLQYFSFSFLLAKHPDLSKFHWGSFFAVSPSVSPGFIFAGNNNPTVCEKPRSFSKLYLQNRHFSSPESGFAKKVHKK